jgi:hypothetical protein
LLSALLVFSVLVPFAAVVSPSFAFEPHAVILTANTNVSNNPAHFFNVKIPLINLYNPLI